MLLEEAVNINLTSMEQELENQASVKPARKRAGRQELPPELRRIKHVTSRVVRLRPVQR